MHLSPGRSRKDLGVPPVVPEFFCAESSFLVLGSLSKEGLGASARARFFPLSILPLPSDVGGVL